VDDDSGVETQVESPCEAMKSSCTVAGMLVAKWRLGLLPVLDENLSDVAFLCEIYASKRCASDEHGGACRKMM
jgi:hypothetical protein